MAIKYNKIDRSNRQLAGLVDGGHELLQCSSCEKPLVDIWITRPDEELDGKLLKTKVQAECCYCGDHSVSKVVTGGFHPGGYGLNDEQDLDAGTQEVYIIEIQTRTMKDENDEEMQHVFFKTKKV